MIVSSTSTNAYAPLTPATAGRRAQQSGPGRQRDQEPRGDRVELAHVAEGEHAQERTPRRRRVRPGEEPAHPAVAQHRHVIDAVGASDHPGHERGDLQPGVRALVRRQAQMLIGQVAQPRPADVEVRVSESFTYEMPLVLDGTEA